MLFRSLYILFSYVLTGVAPYTDFMMKGKEASVAYAIDVYMPGYRWLSTLVTVAILAGFFSLFFVFLLGQSPVFFSMALGGLLSQIFSALPPPFHTPFYYYSLPFIFFYFI